MRFLVFTILLGVPSAWAVAQGIPHPLYTDTTVATIRITIHPDSLALILHPDSALSDHEYPANFVFEMGSIRDSMANIGFRLRGNTSRYSRKKSFKVSFNTFIQGRKLYGIEKLNLNGEHNDPSIIRAKLSWDLFAGAGVPASRASHTRLYINGLYYGLYISVEHVDENFVKTRFGNNNGNLYKCLWPADLVYLGSNPNLYKLIVNGRRVYELKINEDQDDYTDLANLIATINQTPGGTFATMLQRVFNVNSYLRTMAVDVATGSWDNYWFLKNNYYLYHNTATGKFEFIPYDYDNSFGIWWDGISPGIDWGTRNPYTWGHPSESRPLASRIMNEQIFKDRFTFYLNRLLQRQFRSDLLFPRIDSIHAMITQAAEQDSFRTLDYGYTISDFHNSFTQATGGHVTYGLQPYITTRRSNALNQLQLNNIAPIISDLTQWPGQPSSQDSIRFTVRVEDEELNPSVFLSYRINGAWQPQVPMFDDGQHHDGDAGDEVYGVILPTMPAGALVEYYINAVDGGARQTLEPPDAPATLYSFTVHAGGPSLFINEFMAKNESFPDPFGEYDDWIEIYNADSATVWLGDKYLTDNLNNPTKWAFPDTSIGAGEFLLIWADGQPHQGPLHTTFALDRDGEAIGIYMAGSPGFVPIDTIRFGYQPTDVSMGRYPDGGAAWHQFTAPTPGYSNVVPQSYVVTGGWNLVSIPLNLSDYRRSVVYPDAVSPAYAYSSGPGYAIRDTLENGVGYWLKFAAADTVSMTGTVRNHDTLYVSAGWNLIGSISQPVATDSIVQIPSDIVISGYYSYDGGYSPISTLASGRAYWVKVAQSGMLLIGNP
jgi:hypothetical protein